MEPVSPSEKEHFAFSSCSSTESPNTLSSSAHNTATDESKDKRRQYFYPTKDTLSVETLELLSKGENVVKMKKFLENRKLRKIISHLNSTQNPVEEFRRIMQDDEFVAFADFILLTVRQGSNQ